MLRITSEAAGVWRRQRPTLIHWCAGPSETWYDCMYGRPLLM